MGAWLNLIKEELDKVLDTFDDLNNKMKDGLKSVADKIEKGTIATKRATKVCEKLDTIRGLNEEKDSLRTCSSVDNISEDNILGEEISGDEFKESLGIIPDNRYVTNGRVTKNPDADDHTHGNDGEDTDQGDNDADKGGDGDDGDDDERLETIPLYNQELGIMLVTVNNLKDGLKLVANKYDDIERNASERATMVNDKLEAFQLLDERIDKWRLKT